VSEIHVHEEYLEDKVYNDVAVLKVGINPLEEMRYKYCVGEF
jgi:hypothetical protein